MLASPHRARLLLLAVLALSASLLAQDPQSRFVCQTGYTERLCSEHTNVFQSILGRLQPHSFHQPWTWVLVPRGAWPDVVRRLHHHPATTAITMPELHQTWFDGELFGDPSVRQFQLREHWQTDIPHLREYTVSHELAHVVCTREAANENQAERIGGLIRANAAAPCAVRKKSRQLEIEIAHETSAPEAVPDAAKLAPLSSLIRR